MSDSDSIEVKRTPTGWRVRAYGKSAYIYPHGLYAQPQEGKPAQRVQAKPKPKKGPAK